ncbi:MAG: XRE family transcriptional regulator [Deltaproteobacteria bacterium]|nr:MAG: XRE family transcriptional regulator [Deltaproteobacteria bacterium]
MGKFEGMMKEEIVRLARREMKKSFVPLSREVRSMRGVISQLRKTVAGLQRFVTQQEKEMKGKKMPLEAPAEEVKKARFSPRLLMSLRKRLGVTQKEMAALTGVTVGAIYQWEKGIFEPRGEKKRVLVALRKLGRREARKILEEKGGVEKEPKDERKPASKRRVARRGRKRNSKK